MAIRPDLLLGHQFPEAWQTYTRRDAILYALGVRLGADPTDPVELPLLLEDRLAVLPTFAVTLGSPGMWIRAPQFGVDFAKLVHYEQAAVFHQRLAPEGTITARARVVSVTDRGAGKGAVVVLERDVDDASSGRALCTLQQTLLLRGDGGFGGDPPKPQESVMPESDPDCLSSFAIDPRTALIYRLSGDSNPLHADPDAAKRAGFERPILHGLASYAIAGVAVARALGRSPDALASLGCRFAGIVFPGDRLDFRIWREGRGGAFQAFAGERKALDRGFATFGDAP
jgi:acyl dehydratase